MLFCQGIKKLTKCFNLPFGLFKITSGCIRSPISTINSQLIQLVVRHITKYSF